MKEKLILLVGDVHGEVPILKGVQYKIDFLKTKYRIESNDDIVVIFLGDFCFNYVCNDLERKIKTNVMKEFPYLSLCVLGNHDNYDKIYTFPKEKIFGANAYKDPDASRLYYIENGEVLTINDKNYLCYGGGFSIDFIKRIYHSFETGFKTYWGREFDGDNMGKGILNAKNKKIDAVFTHDCPESIFDKIMKTMKLVPHPCFLQTYFEHLYNDIFNKNIKWFSAHYHPKSLLKFDNSYYVLPIGYVLDYSHLEEK